jgi:hypothetical protein
MSHALVSAAAGPEFSAKIIFFKGGRRRESFIGPSRHMGCRGPAIDRRNPYRSTIDIMVSA